MRKTGMKPIGYLGFWIVAGICAPAPAADDPVTAMASGQEAQEELMVTVYNNGYGLVREVRRITLPEGLVELEFQDVAEKIDPTSVAFKSLTAPGGVAILEQNYRYDLLSPKTLLDRAVGQEVRITRYNDQGQQRFEFGTLLATNSGTIVRIGDEIVINPPGTIALKQVPSDLVSKPTLVWLLRNTIEGEQKIEASYLTNGMTWKADYVVVVNEDDTAIDLTGWVTLENGSGATYREAKLKLVAGDVQRVREALPRQVTYFAADAAAVPKEAFAEKSFFEYHLYTLGRPATIANRETKQITLLEGNDISVEKVYIMESPPWTVQANVRGVAKKKFSVMLDFENREENNLGMALPKGRIRVYKADTDASLQLIGEDNIDHTPKDEKIRVKLGEAFDLVAERRQTKYRKLGKRMAEFSYEIKARNHKQEAVGVTILEHVFGDWEITDESNKHINRDSRTIEFNLDIPADGEATLTYTARVRW